MHCCPRTMHFLSFPFSPLPQFFEIFTRPRGRCPTSPPPPLFIQSPTRRHRGTLHEVKGLVCCFLLFPSFGAPFPSTFPPFKADGCTFRPPPPGYKHQWKDFATGSSSLLLLPLSPPDRGSFFIWIYIVGLHCSIPLGLRRSEIGQSSFF